MLSRVKKRAALYQIAVVALVMAVVFTFVGLFIYSRMITEVDKKIAVLEESYRDFFQNQGAPNPDDKYDSVYRNSLIIALREDGGYKVSDKEFYSEETLVQLIEAIKNRQEDRVKIDDKNIAYKVVDNVGSGAYTAIVCCYDYTHDYTTYTVNVVTILMTAFAVILVVSILVIRFNGKSFATVENAFFKQKELVANASHELKTPLTIINTNLSIINSYDNLTEEQKKWLSGIATQTQRMGELINEMLVLARVEGMKEKQNLERINFSTIVESVVLETETVAFEKGAMLTSSVQEDVFVKGRKQDLEKLVYILLDNAIKYTPFGKEIRLKLSVEKRKVMLRVYNEGEGIEKEKLPKLFDRFYRADESHSVGGSFGLGLAIAKAIVDSMDGRIGVDSEVAKYTEFICVFKES